MKRWALLCAVMLLFAGIASAQDDSKVTVFGGYSYLRFNPGQGVSGLNFNGGSGSIAYDVLPWVGVVADVGGYHWSGSGGSDATAVSYLFGPKVSMHAGPVTPFVHALFGGVHGSGSNGTFCTVVDVRVHSQGTTGGSGCSASENAFATALGGGLDWNATPHIGVRLVQAEYVLTRFGFGGPNYTQNNVRVSAGVTFRF
jgi:hypothetical protein